MWALAEQKGLERSEGIFVNIAGAQELQGSEDPPGISRRNFLGKAGQVGMRWRGI